MLFCRAIIEADAMKALDQLLPSHRRLVRSTRVIRLENIALVCTRAKVLESVRLQNLKIAIQSDL